LGLVVDNEGTHFLRMHSQDELYSPMVGTLAQIEMLRNDGVVVSHFGRVEAQKPEGFVLFDMANQLRRSFDPKKIIRLNSVSKWLQKSGLLFVSPKSGEVKKSVILGQIQNLDLVTQEIHFLSSLDSTTIRVPMSEVHAFVDLTSFRDTIAQKVKVLFGEKGKGESLPPPIESDLEMVDWKNGELVFSHRDNPNDLSVVQIENLATFRPYFSQGI